MSVTATIQELLQGIMDSQYGRDMRQFIHDAIQKCYEEGSAGETDLVARGMIEDLLGNFATVESSSTASRAYSEGELLVYNSIMYKVTASIAQGGTITPGTNCQATTIEESYESNLNANIKTSLALNESYYMNGFHDSASYFYKNGRTVVVRIDVTFNGTPGTAYSQVYTLPEGYRPSGDTNYSIVADTSSGDIFWVRIATSGSITICHASGGTGSGTDMYLKNEFRFDLFGAST